ncbi:uncharacterized protein [Procambarus clarkii]|uniref:uncharacterized protein n=1 Tax=Procambarus clarkii TaxID=6728 RepID=UPI001E67136B|nr:uncharacterized protein LOC123774401 [Procambarus clarkii]
MQALRLYFLERNYQRLRKSLSPDSVASHQRFFTAASRIDPSRICVDKVLETMMFVNDFRDTDITRLNLTRTRLGLFWAQTFASFMGTKSVIMTGKWENVLWNIVMLVRHWRPDFILDNALHSPILKSWILKLFVDPNLCPSPDLRLEMLRFIGMWPMAYFEDSTSGRQAAAGLVATSAYLYIYPPITSELEKSVYHHLVKVWNSLNIYGHLNVVAEAAIDQVRSLIIGPEVTFLNNMLQLLMQTAAEMPRTYATYSNGIYHAAKLFQNIVYLFQLFVTTNPIIEAYNCPGLTQTAAVSLFTITFHIITMSSTFAVKRKLDVGLLLRLFPSLDDLYKKVSSTHISRVLRIRYGELLSSLNKQVAVTGFHFNNFPTPEESTEECPEQFVDSLTQAVMEAPVLLQSSKMVVDESTLVHLLLEFPSDPFTRCPLDPGSFSRLPDLQADIAAWRNTSRGHNDVNVSSRTYDDNGDSSDVASNDDYYFGDDDDYFFGDDAYYWSDDLYYWSDDDDDDFTEYDFNIGHDTNISSDDDTDDIIVSSVSWSECQLSNLLHQFYHI